MFVLNIKTNHMNVKELKEAIANLPDEMQIVLQKDPEGNGYSPIDGADPNSVYTEDGEVYDMSWSADDACMTNEEWESMKVKPRTLILYPKY